MNIDVPQLLIYGRRCAFAVLPVRLPARAGRKTDGLVRRSGGTNPSGAGVV
jgi:hypothetical protein